MKTAQSVTYFKYSAIFMLLVLLFTGCASSGTLHTITIPTVKLSKYKTLHIDASSQISDSTQEIVQLESMIAARLRAIGSFEKVVAGSAYSKTSTELQLNVTIVSLKKVSPGARFLLGALAGRAKVVVNAELIDLKKGETIGTFKTEGKSSGGTIFAGTTTQAIERSVEQIVQFVQKSM